MTDDWQLDALDMRAYLDRIGLEEEPIFADLDALRLLHRAHVLAIPFENLDIPLGRGIDLDLEAIQDKLVRRRRGGYCYEHNLLFAAVLEHLAFDVTRYAARVVMGSDKVNARSHAASRVSFYGTDYLADVGFGPDGLIEPILFQDGAVAEQAGRMYRVRLYGEECVLSDHRSHRWFGLYRLGAEPQHPIDFEVSNHYISTHPRSPFTGRIFAGRVTPDERRVLNGRELTRSRRGADAEVTQVEDGELGQVLDETFGIALSEDELDVLRKALPVSTAD